MKDAWFRYVQARAESDIVNPFSYWYHLYKSGNSLAGMGLDIFSILSRSANPERLFSWGKHILTDTRNRLRLDALEAYYA